MSLKLQWSGLVTNTVCYSSISNRVQGRIWGYEVNTRQYRVYLDGFNIVFTGGNLLYIYFKMFEFSFMTICFRKLGFVSENTVMHDVFPANVDFWLTFKLLILSP